MSRLPARVLAAARVADDEDGRRRPVKDVVAPGRFLLIAGDGAIVVRPDRFIAWRFPAAASDPWPSSPPCSARPLAADRCSARVGGFLACAGAARR